MSEATKLRLIEEFMAMVALEGSDELFGLTRRRGPGEPAPGRMEMKDIRDRFTRFMNSLLKKPTGGVTEEGLLNLMDFAAGVGNERFEVFQLMHRFMDQTRLLQQLGIQRLEPTEPLRDVGTQTLLDDIQGVLTRSLANVAAETIPTLMFEADRGIEIDLTRPLTEVAGNLMEIGMNFNQDLNVNEGALVLRAPGVTDIPPVPAIDPMVLQRREWLAQGLDIEGQPIDMSAFAQHLGQQMDVEFAPEQKGYMDMLNDIIKYGGVLKSGHDKLLKVAEQIPELAGAAKFYSSHAADLSNAIIQAALSQRAGHSWVEGLARVFAATAISTRLGRIKSPWAVKKSSVFLSWVLFEGIKTFGPMAIDAFKMIPGITAPVIKELSELAATHRALHGAPPELLDEFSLETPEQLTQEEINIQIGENSRVPTNKAPNWYEPPTAGRNGINEGRVMAPPPSSYKTLQNAEPITQIGTNVKNARPPRAGFGITMKDRGPSQLRIGAGRPRQEAPPPIYEPINGVTVAPVNTGASGAPPAGGSSFENFERYKEEVRQLYIKLKKQEIINEKMRQTIRELEMIGKQNRGKQANIGDHAAGSGMMFAKTRSKKDKNRAADMYLSKHYFVYEKALAEMKAKTKKKAQKAKYTRPVINQSQYF